MRPPRLAAWILRRALPYTDRAAILGDLAEEFEQRRIAGSASKLFAERIPTRPFNGYGPQVASLYAGMDLRKWF